MATSGGSGPIATSNGAGILTNSNVPQSIALAHVFSGSSWAPIREPGDYLDGVNGSNLAGVQPYALSTGTLFDRLRTPRVFKPLSAVAVGTEATIWTPAAGKKFRLMGFVLDQGTATGDVTLRDNTAGTTIFVIPANPVGTAVTVNLGNGILSAAANNLLTAQGVATETLSGTVWGTEE